MKEKISGRLSKFPKNISSQRRRQMEKDELEEDVAAKDSSEVDGLWEWTRKIK